MSVWDYMADRTTRRAELAALRAGVGSAERRTSAAGRCRGARSTASSATTARSCRRSMMRKPSTRCRSPPPQWGSLASFGAKRYPGTKRYYGTSGNSFVAVGRVRPEGARLGGHAPAARAGIPNRSISTIRRSATPTVICARCISIRRTSRVTSSAATAPGKATADRSFCVREGRGAARR